SDEPEAFAAALAGSYGSVTADYKGGGATKLPNGTFRISGTFTLKIDTVAHTDIVFHREEQFFILALKCNEKSLATHLPLLEEAAATFELIEPAKFSEADRARFKELFERGMKAAREGEQTQQAIEDLRAAAEMLPGLPDIHSTLAHLYTLDGKLDLATKELRALVELLPDSADCLYNLGTHYYKLNRYEDAVENLKKAIELNPNYVEAHLNLGVILKLKGQVDEAIRAIRRALEIEPSSVTAHFNLGQIYLQKNNPREARQAFEKVLELEPNHAGAKGALEEMNKTAPPK
ncbi:MAG: tetratricopeptide repeat protein, partial [Planctomycetota bacterium]|nr:tetratricopeptide repeat protein [Planctomycetota bacterium]